ncbi:hypothetical protein KKI24_23805 [bacterium]|nr:hypothetical protein [bacterium]
MKKNTGKKSPASNPAISIPGDPYRQIRSIWILRMILYTNSHREFLRREDNEDENFMRVIGLKPMKKKELSGKSVLTCIYRLVTTSETGTSLPAGLENLIHRYGAILFPFEKPQPWVKAFQKRKEWQ